MPEKAWRWSAFSIASDTSCSRKRNRGSSPPWPRSSPRRQRPGSGRNPKRRRTQRSLRWYGMTGIGSGGRYELKFVPDGDYILLANVVLDDGEILIMAGSYGAEDLESGSAPLLVEGVSLTDVDVDLFHIGVDTVDAREVTVAGVDVKGGFLYFDDSDGDRVTVSVFPILGSILDLEGNLIEFSDLGVGSVVLVSGLMVVGEIVAFEIRVVSLPPSPADFNGDGIVGLEDFFAFAEVYGSVKGDGIYQAKFDLNRNGSIGLEDFFIFAESFGY